MGDVSSLGVCPEGKVGPQPPPLCQDILSTMIGCEAARTASLSKLMTLILGISYNGRKLTNTSIQPTREQGLMASFLHASYVACKARIQVNYRKLCTLQLPWRDEFPLFTKRAKMGTDW